MQGEAEGGGGAGRGGVSGGGAAALAFSGPGAPMAELVLRGVFSMGSPRFSRILSYGHGKEALDMGVSRLL